MRKVYWTKLAISDFRKNIEFLKLRWNDIVIFDFIEKTECVIEIICDNPESGRWDQDIHCNKILVKKHIPFL
jgi:plasmid stabilization system protein ParE